MPATVNILQVPTKLLNLLFLITLPTLPNPSSIHGTTNYNIYNLHLDDTFQSFIRSLNARFLLNKISHAMTLLLPVNPDNFLITGMWCESTMSDHSLNVDNCFYFYTTDSIQCEAVQLLMFI